MKYPFISTNGTQQVNIPALSGGLNIDNNATLVNDNQLTESKNVWWDGSALCGRPAADIADITGYNSAGYEFTGQEVVVFDRSIVLQKLPTRHLLRLFKNTVKKCFAVIDIAYGIDNDKEGVYTNALDIDKMSWGDGDTVNCVLYSAAGKTIHTNGGVFILFSKLTAQGEQSAAYCELATHSAGTGGISFYNAVNDVNINSEGYYVPTLYLNGKGNKYSLLPSSGESYAAASMFESLNMLGGRFKMQFHTDGISERFVFPISDINTKNAVSSTYNDMISSATVEINGVFGIYDSSNPSSKKELSGVIYSGFSKSNDTGITLMSDEYISQSATDGSFSAYYYFDAVCHNLMYLKTLDSAHSAQGTVSGRVYCIINPVEGYVRFASPGAELSVTVSGTPSMTTIYDIPIPDAGNVASNMTVTMPHFDFESADTICSMSVSAEFGGAGGLYNGSRVFLAGGKAAALMHWSDLNSPLYFPENNYSFVGSKTQRITAFGKQADMLVIFKSHEIFYTKYVSGGEITADDVTSGKVIDVAASAAVFPLYPLHDTVGCDLPRTVQLCNNRLVWATTDGEVYTLVTAYNTSEHNVYAISSPVHSGIALLNGGFALDWRGHYVLVSDNKCFVLNYDQYNYKYVASFSDGNRKFTWWYWELSRPFNSGFVYGERMILVSSGRTGVLTDKSTTQYDIPEICFTSKLWNFISPQQNKKIESVYLYALEGKGIKVSFLSDQGTEHMPPFDLYKLDEANIGFMGDTKKLIPRIWRTRLFGFSVSATAPFRLGAVSINYKPTGTVK